MPDAVFLFFSVVYFSLLKLEEVQSAKVRIFEKTYVVGYKYLSYMRHPGRHHLDASQLTRKMISVTTMPVTMMTTGWPGFHHHRGRTARFQPRLRLRHDRVDVVRDGRWSSLHHRR